MRLIVIAAALAVANTSYAVSAADFNGFHVGVQAGYGDREVSRRIGTVRFAGDRASAQLGGFLGYDVRLGQDVVAGIEGEVGKGGRSFAIEDRSGTRIELDPKWNYAVTGRLGVRARNGLLVYGRAGYGAERVTADFRGPVPAVIGFPTRTTGWSEGLIVGGGVELQLTRRLLGRGEYRYRDMQGGYKGNQALIGLSFRL